MSSEQIDIEDVHRKSFSYFALGTAVVVAVLVVAWLVQAVTKHNPHEYLPPAGIGALVMAYLLYLARSSIDARPDVLVVRNRMRTWVIPGADVVDVRVIHSRFRARYGWLWHGVAVLTSDGAEVHCEGLRSGHPQCLRVSSALWRRRVATAGALDDEARPHLSHIQVLAPWSRVPG